MDDHPPFPASDPAELARARAARRAEVLEELIEVAMGVARLIGRQVTRQAVFETDTTGLVLAFTRVSRCVRQCVALAARLDEERPPSAREARIEPEPRAAPAPIAAEPALESEARERGDGGEAENLSAELNERLEDGDELAGFDRLSFAEAVARICRDLGVSFDLSRLEDEDFVAPGQSAGDVADQRRRLMASLPAAAAGEGGKPAPSRSRSAPKKSLGPRVRGDERGMTVAGLTSSRAPAGP